MTSRVEGGARELGARELPELSARALPSLNLLLPPLGEPAARKFSAAVREDLTISSALMLWLRIMACLGMSAVLPLCSFSSRFTPLYCSCGSLVLAEITLFTAATVLHSSAFLRFAPVAARGGGGVRGGVQ